MATTAEVLSDEEEFHSATEDGDEREGKNERPSVREDEEDSRTLRAGLDNLDLKSDVADNDRTTASASGEDEQVKRDVETEGDAKMSGLDNRYVSEEHEPEKDGGVELTEEQIKVYQL